jgi:hypothetical protein
MHSACGLLELDPRREEGYMHLPKGVKVPTGFSANVKKLVSMKDLSITHLKAHDCHVMLTVFLPIVIRAIKPGFLKMAITLMCYFFSKISQKVIDKKGLSDLHDFAVET